MPNDPDFTSGWLGCQRSPQTDKRTALGPTENRQDAAGTGSAQGRHRRLPGGLRGWAGCLSAGKPGPSAAVGDSALAQAAQASPGTGRWLLRQGPSRRPQRLPWLQPRSGAELGADPDPSCGAAMHPSLFLFPCGKMEASPGWERGFIPFLCLSWRREKHWQNPTGA